MHIFGTNLGSATITVASATTTMVDTANTISKFSISPVFFTISALAGGAFTALGHLYLKDKLDFEPAGGYYVSVCSYASSALSTVAGFLPSILLRASTVAFKALSNSTFCGFRFGVMATHTVLHGIHVLNNVNGD